MVDLKAFNMTAVRDIREMPLLKILLRPAAWTRLEPQSLSGDPAPWIEARVHDPLWFLGRQWQAGEFQGEDCGTPVSVHLKASSAALTALVPGSGDETPIGPETVIEPLVEREPWHKPCLRDRADAGSALVAALRDGGGDVAAALAACPFSADELKAAGPEWRLIARRIPDAELAAEALEAGTPPWAGGAAADWLAWYRRNVSARAAVSESWVAKRLEYQFGVKAGGVTMPAPMHDGGPLDWFTFEGGADAVLETAHEARVYAMRLRYPGMPADRYWQFEDGRVNFGAMDVQPGDLIRLCFLEFATICGNDWLVAPIDLPRGVIARMDHVSYRTTFGEEFVVPRAADIGRKGRFGLFSPGPDGLMMIPPGGRRAQEGPAREEVIFARDEMANLCWAIEASVEGPEGLARDRRAETAMIDPILPAAAGTDLVYRLETEVPPWWIPMVPVPEGKFGGFFLRKGSFDGTDASQGRILAGPRFDVFDEEIPREGVRVRRVPSLIRDENGTLVRWTARRVAPAQGESASNLAYDSAFRGTTIPTA